MFASFARAVTALNRWIGRLAAWVVIPLFLLLICDVVMRYFAGRPLIWTSETAQLVFAVYGIIGGGWLLAERGHVNVDIFYGTLSPRRKAVADLATCFLFLLFVGILLWQGWSLAMESFDKLERSNSVWKPQVWPVKFFVPLAALLLLAQGIVRIVADIRTVMGLPCPDEIYGAPAHDPADDVAREAEGVE